LSGLLVAVERPTFSTNINTVRNGPKRNSMWAGFRTVLGKV